ncbi:MaoC family dehydratase N-terminal domain-containing protein [Nocardioides sp. NPDC023903]|uniref:FAS1-like dehydratase domain-containing protein n=1 Tax=Nocardioides sp. NPDC023903 TaxID=3157195 RepID=UPI0034012ED1
MTEIREIAEILMPGPALALSELLDVSCPDFESGEALPLTWHWLYLLDRPHQRDLGDDGHPVRNAFPTPPATGLRRMWAGGMVQSVRPLRVGELASRRSKIDRVVRKKGRTGPLMFVTVEHEVVQRGDTAVRERQDIVYREPSARGADDADEPSPEVVQRREGDWSIPVSPTLLFRFSALTYNAHRIHYDRDYAGTVEGYPGLVTHGPLQAMAMAERARAQGAMPVGFSATFEYTLIAPLFDHQGLIVRADPGLGSWTTTARDVTGRRTASGTVISV